MPKHHSEDYKVSAVKHYLNKTNNLTKTCEEFNCSVIINGYLIGPVGLEENNFLNSLNIKNKKI